MLNVSDSAINEDRPIRLIWKCLDCKDVIVSYSNRHHDINFCDCRKSSVDLEKFSCGTSGYIEFISEKVLINEKWIKINPDYDEM